jgi:hypothetical protein
MYFRTCSIHYKTPNASGVAVSSIYQYNFEQNILAQQEYMLYVYLRHLLSILTMFYLRPFMLNLFDQFSIFSYNIFVVSQSPLNDQTKSDNLRKMYSIIAYPIPAL